MTSDQKNVYLLLGDLALVQKRTQELCTQLLPDGSNPTNYVRHEAESATEQPFVDAQTISMFSHEKVILLSGMEKANIQLLDNLLQYIENPNPRSFLIMCGENLPKKGPVQRIRKKLKASGGLEKFDRKNIQPQMHLREMLAAANVRLSSSAAQLLIQMVGKDLFSMQNEVSKIACYVGTENKMITEADIENVCSVVAEANIWELSDAIVRKDLNQALSKLYRMLEERKAPHHLFGIICWQMRQLLELQEWLDSGKRQPPKSWVRIPYKKRELASRTLRKHPLEAHKILTRLIAANRSFNSAHSGDRRNIEDLVISLCRQ